MAESFVLGYLHTVCSKQYAAAKHTHQFFENRLSFDAPAHEEAMAQQNALKDLPIHTILLEVHRHATAKTDEELKAAAVFFTPLILHHWQLLRLAEMLRCQIKENLADSLSFGEEQKKALQSALLLTTLLNTVFRQGMSAAWLSDRFKLEERRNEYGELLAAHYGIAFGDRFTAVFATHASVLGTEENTFEFNNICAWLAGLVSKANRYIQGVHRPGNTWRLGALRLQRCLMSLIPFLNMEFYTNNITYLNGFVQPFLTYFNWLFFIPRLALNFSILGHHIWNDAKLALLEKNIDRTTRFRAHWTRVWAEVLIDLHWFSNSWILCFIVTGGSASLACIYVRMAIQILDLLVALAQAGFNLYNLYTMSTAINAGSFAADPLRDYLSERDSFEWRSAGYNLFHFSILLVALCLTLPSMAAISTMLPVVGGTTAVLMTILTDYVQGSKEGFNQEREKTYHCLSA
ncbi:MAG: hypothetical protein NXI01_03530 [Gammaproteobacteria bacterium]|nr:hypothetical protein [Gammaproteobacteria bacterium]